MSSIFMIALSSFVFAGAISLDALGAAIAYGADRIRIPIYSSLVIASVCTGCLAISLFFGYAIASVVPAFLTRLIGFLILCIIGGTKLIDSGIKVWIRKRKVNQKQINFTAFHFKFILTIYADPQKADVDHSRVLSPGEAFSLALALSLDGLAAGIGGGFIHFHVLSVLLFTFLFTMICVVGGSKIGERLARKTTMDLSFVSGMVLIMLALIKFI